MSLDGSLRGAHGPNYVFNGGITDAARKHKSYAKHRKAVSGRIIEEWQTALRSCPGLRLRTDWVEQKDSLARTALTPKCPWQTAGVVRPSSSGGNLLLGQTDFLV